MVRRAVVVVVVALALVGVVLGGNTWYAHAHRQVPVVVDAACPPLMTNTSNGADDYGDVVEWGGQSYWRSERKVTAGRQVGVVGCSVSSMPNAKGLRVSQLPWPDGTSTSLPVGTTLHLPDRARPRSALVARTGAGDRLYCLEDDPAGPATC